MPQKTHGTNCCDRASSRTPRRQSPLSKSPRRRRSRLPSAARRGTVACHSRTPAAGLELAELEKFLVNFVVEQTGYPPEVVELDADLEADLGIDSIKKAQMFGELQEYFDVTPLPPPRAWRT